MEVPVYLNNAFGSIKALGRHLSLPPSYLEDLANRADQYYSLPRNPAYKSNGQIREVFSVKRPLKLVQQQIKKKIFWSVKYPYYLQGSAPKQGKRRNYITNANIHTKKRILLGEDISDFFSSITAVQVERMWRYLFHFPVSIASLLTKLTTYQGRVPQGASTSSFIGNLILWDKEPKFVMELSNRGFYYTRYVDDITISSKEYISKEELQGITSRLYALLSSKGIKPNRRKRTVQSNSGLMTVHKLPVNSSKPTLGRRKRSRIRAEVKQIEDIAAGDRSTEYYKARYDSLRGKLADAAQIEPQKVQAYLNRILQIKPKN